MNALCLARYRRSQQARSDYSDPRVVAVTDYAPWTTGGRPAGGVRYLDSRELRELYSPRGDSEARLRPPIRVRDRRA